MSELYDTCVFIDYWRGDAAAVALVNFARGAPKASFYSPITATELWQSPLLKRREEIEFVALARYFLQEAPLTTSAATKAGQLLRSFSRNARMHLAADALISATASDNGATVRTRNIKDFRKVSTNVQTY